MVLLSKRGVWAAFDGWVRSLSEEAFTRVLPMARRAFADFTGPERRQMAGLLKTIGDAPAAGPAATESEDIDHARAARVLPVLREVLGNV